MTRVLPILIVLLTVSPAAAQQSEKSERPASLTPLYLSLITLNGLDMHSSKEALMRGHREANPYLKDAGNNKIIAAKVATSATTMWMAEKLWKKNRFASVAMLVTANVALGAIVANNYRIAYDVGRTRPGPRWVRPSP